MSIAGEELLGIVLFCENFEKYFEIEFDGKL